MLRFVALSIFALVLVPLASADGVAVGPHGLADPTRNEHYYVWLRASAPESPHGGAGADDDCAAGTQPGMTGSARELAGDLSAWKPMEDFGAGTWAPTCVAVESGCSAGSGTPCIPVASLVPGAYAAYDVATGRYYLEASSSAIPGAPSGQTVALTGTTGMSFLFDCVGCTPPVCCDN